jgi:hypothetical protein
VNNMDDDYKPAIEYQRLTERNESRRRNRDHFNHGEAVSERSPVTVQSVRVDFVGSRDSPA